MRLISLENKLSLNRECYTSWCGHDLNERLAKLAESQDEIERKLLMEEIQGIRRLQ